MIALKRYIINKFNSIIYEQDDYNICVDIINKKSMFHGNSIYFMLEDNFIEADLAVLDINSDIAINKLLTLGFYIDEIHNHNEYQHIHISAKLSKENIDLLEELIK
jgi:hypothetical protein